LARIPYRLKAILVFGSVLLKEVREIQKRLPKYFVLAEHEGDQKAPETTVAIHKWMVSNCAWAIPARTRYGIGRRYKQSVLQQRARGTNPVLLVSEFASILVLPGLGPREVALNEFL